MAAQGGDASWLQWAIGLIAGIGGIGLGALSAAIHKVREDANKSVTALWQRVNSMTDLDAGLRERAAERFATREELAELRRHLDERFDRLTALVVKGKG